MSRLFVSIVVPTYNRADLLRDCLRSLLAQDYPHDRYEIIVVDDGSTDTTPAVVKNFTGGGPAVYYARTCGPGPNGGRGPNAARNVGIRVARGELVAFLDDDVVCSPSWLSWIVPDDCDPVELVYGPVPLLPGILLPSKHREEWVYLTDVPHPSIPIFANMLVRRAVFDRGYPSEEWRPPMEETEWLRRVRPVTHFAPNAMVIHHKTPGDVRVSRLVRTAWLRGRECGRFARRVERKRADEIVRVAARSLWAVGHALLGRCWGGVFVAVGHAAFVWGWLRG